MSPERQWLEMSMFKDRWTPDGELVIQSSLAPEAVSVSLSVEPDSVYYWRLRVESDGQIFTTAIEQLNTPSCIADFVDGS